MLHLSIKVKYKTYAKMSFARVLLFLFSAFEQTTNKTSLTQGTEQTVTSGHHGSSSDISENHLINQPAREQQVGGLCALPWSCSVPHLL